MSLGIFEFDTEAGLYHTVTQVAVPFSGEHMYAHPPWQYRSIGQRVRKSRDCQTHAMHLEFPLAEPLKCTRSADHGYGGSDNLSTADVDRGCWYFACRVCGGGTVLIRGGNVFDAALVRMLSPGKRSVRSIWKCPMPSTALHVG